ncbi:MAG: DDE-type integrase/transposase/recombinase, partial [Candidatus Thiodiazotropha endolucinida]|nr:DDE-type integrase/transposase/recombinase [Candidatus Thiodiazotropha taylori]MCW4342763.1 DDE-type integrase/transposase/recombinase [Candidatus Thiodiazotropha endolucinida]
VVRTKARIKEKFLWYQMSSDVEQYVLSCSTCSQKKKGGPHGHYPMQEYHAGAPMERVHIDFLGPLPKTATGNEHILVMVDQFTKWAEMIPLPTQTAETTARAAVNEFFMRFGCPFQLHSDQGRNFESRLFTAVCEVLQIQKKRTTPYRPSANGQAERYNRTIMDAVRCYVGKKAVIWDPHLPKLAGALRSSVNRQTGYTPNKLMLGREVNTPVDLVFPLPQSVETMEVGTFVKDLVQNMQKAHEIARQTLKSSQKIQKKRYDLRVLERSYNEGDIVYLMDTASIKGKCKKLSVPWKGPAIITKKISPALFRIKLKNAVFTVNHDRIKPCRDRTLPNWIVNFIQKPKDSENNKNNEDSNIYCFCRTTWNNQFMIH